MTKPHPKKPRTGGTPPNMKSAPKVNADTAASLEPVPMPEMTSTEEPSTEKPPPERTDNNGIEYVLLN